MYKLEDKAMKTMEEVKSRMGDVACPVCHHTEWDVVYRCDLDYSGCLYDATCENCDYHMEVTEGGQLIEEEYADDVAKITSAPCATCGSHDVSIHYRCELADKKCLYVSVCNRCHTVTKIDNV